MQIEIPLTEELINNMIKRGWLTLNQLNDRLAVYHACNKMFDEVYEKTGIKFKMTSM